MNGLVAALRWRGFKLVAHDSPQKVILPGKEGLLESYYQLLRDYYFRRILADLVQMKEWEEGEGALVHRWSREACAKYLPAFERLGFLQIKKGHFRFFRPELDNFGETFEWFLGEVLRREFHAEAMYGVRLQGVMGGGDYDVLGLLGDTLIYLEGKASPPNNVPCAEIERFLEREEALGCDCALIVNDTTLRIERNILANLLYALRQKYGLTREECSSAVRPLSPNIYFISPKLFVLNSKRDVVTNLERVFYYYFHRRSPGFKQ